jgi:hypothetical protein
MTGAGPSVLVPLRSSSCLSPDLVLARPFPSVLTTMAFDYSRRRLFGPCRPVPRGHPHQLSSYALLSLSAFRARGARLSATLPRKPLPQTQSLNGRFAHDSARSSRHMPSDDGQILRRSTESPDDRSRLSQDCTEPGGGGYGNLMLTLERQAAFVEEAPELFLPIPDGCGNMGHTHNSPGGGERRCTDGSTANGLEKLGIDKNAKTGRKNPHMAERSGVTDKKRGKRRL